MQLTINGSTYSVESEADTPLLWVIRDELDMTGTKFGCGIAQCGACSVLVDGAIVRSCVTPVSTVQGKNITTIEAVENDGIGKRVVEAWIKHQVPQCGYCQSGQVMAATALLQKNSHPSEEDISAAMVNLCRCGTYNAIRAAVHDVAGLASNAPDTSSAASAEPSDKNLLAGNSVAVIGLVGAIAGSLKSVNAARPDSDEV